MKGKAIKKGVNLAGKKYALVEYVDGTYGVYARCSNYNGHVRGGIEYTWRYCKKGLDRGQADALYLKKLAGREK